MTQFFLLGTPWDPLKGPGGINALAQNMGRNLITLLKVHEYK